MSLPDARLSAVDKARIFIAGNSGLIKTVQALNAGIQPRTLYALRDSGELTQISRGVYRLSNLDQPSDTDMLIVAARIPDAVICLISALAYHQITTQIPHAISIAVARGKETPRIDYPPLTIHRFSGQSLTAGIEERTLDGLKLHIYSVEKTLADCFKMRNHVGIDVVIEAMKLYRIRKPLKVNELIKFARICRVEKVMKPYIEMIL
ncbi:MAG: type IV toxin-antitoxin system AbiEi family antitoxin domain-containing protein [Armatimonadota bacterium]